MPRIDFGSLKRDGGLVRGVVTMGVRGSGRLDSGSLFFSGTEMESGELIIESDYSGWFRSSLGLRWVGIQGGVCKGSESVAFG